MARVVLQRQVVEAGQPEGHGRRRDHAEHTPGERPELGAAPRQCRHPLDRQVQPDGGPGVEADLHVRAQQLEAAGQRQPRQVVQPAASQPARRQPQHERQVGRVHELAAVAVRAHRHQVRSEDEGRGRQQRPLGPRAQLAGQQEHEQRPEEVVEEHPGHVGQRHDLVHQRQRPVGRVDERVVGAAGERRHAQEDVRVPQRVDVLLVQGLLADPHEAGRGRRVGRDERLALEHQRVEEQHREQREDQRRSAGGQREGAAALRGRGSRGLSGHDGGRACGRTCSPRGWSGPAAQDTAGRPSAGPATRRSISSTMRAASASQSCGTRQGARRRRVARRVEGARQRPSQPGDVGGELQQGRRRGQVEHRRGHDRQPGGEELVDLVRVDALHVRQRGTERDHADVQPLQPGRHVRVRPRTGDEHAGARRQRPHLRPGGRVAGTDEHQRAAAARAAQGLEQLEVEEVREQAEVADARARQRRQLGRHLPRRGEALELDPVAQRHEGPVRLRAQLPPVVLGDHEDGVHLGQGALPVAAGPGRGRGELKGRIVEVVE